MAVLFFGVFVSLLTLISWVEPVRADTFVAASCNNTAASPHIQNAVNLTVAGRNDTVLLPNGSCVISQLVTMPGHGLTLAAQNPPTLGTVQGKSGIPTAFTTTITDAMGNCNPMLLWTTANNGQLYRITGINWVGGGVNCSSPNSPMRILGLNRQFRFDHNNVTVGSRPWFLWPDNVEGVLDHNTFTVAGGYLGYFHTGSYNGNTNGCPSISGTACGDSAWGNPLELGSSRWVFFEDNIWQGPAAAWGICSDGWAGMKVVYRFNIFNNCVPANHGADSTLRGNGMLAAEVYGNRINTTTQIESLFGWRSGTGLMFNNTHNRTDIKGFGRYTFYRWLCDELPPPSTLGCDHHAGRAEPFTVSLTSVGTSATASVTGGLQHKLERITAGWDKWVRISGAAGNYNGIVKVTSLPSGSIFTFTCATTCGGNTTATVTSAWDFDSTGYPAFQGIGRGPGNLQGSGLNPLPAQWLNQVLTPIYVFNNFVDGRVAVCGGLSGNNCDDYSLPTPFQINRDVYTQQGVAGDGSTSGVGVGSTLPATCVTSSEPGGGVAWWKTNEGEWNSTNGATPDGRLYRCSATNTWTLYYTPYTYPHPLVDGGGPPPDTTPPAAPTGLVISDNGENG